MLNYPVVLSLSWLEYTALSSWKPVRNKKKKEELASHKFLGRHSETQMLPLSPTS